MKIKDVMSKECQFVPHNATLQQAAQKMQELDCGFIPVGKDNKLCGVITDRDIAVRAVAQNLANDTPVSQIMSEQVLYCFETDDVNQIATNMTENRVRRLVVLDNKKDKKLCGVVSICDIVNANRTEAETSSKLIRGVSQQGGKNSQSANKGSKAA